MSEVHTDKTWFDDKLKSNLYLDLALRALVWLTIAFATIVYASNEVGFSPIAPLQKSMTSLMPVVLDVTRVSTILCFTALLLKDLEFVSPTAWGQQTILGRIGGVIRRLAGDLSLWIVGALVTCMASIGYLYLFAYTHNALSRDLVNFCLFMTAIFGIFVGVFSLVCVWVRKSRSLISSHAKFIEIFNKPWKVLMFYIALGIAPWVLG